MPCKNDITVTRPESQGNSPAEQQDRVQETGIGDVSAKPLVGRHSDQAYRAKGGSAGRFRALLGATF